VVLCGAAWPPIRRLLPPKSLASLPSHPEVLACWPLRQSVTSAPATSTHAPPRSQVAVVQSRRRRRPILCTGNRTGSPSNSCLLVFPLDPHQRLVPRLYSQKDGARAAHSPPRLIARFARLLPASTDSKAGDPRAQPQPATHPSGRVVASAKPVLSFPPFPHQPDRSPS